jgi:flagellar biosynthesis protein FlhG
MKDQAETLRVLKTSSNVISLPRVEGRSIAVSGGKGGVGKSALAVNLAACYAARGKKTLLVDGDAGMADLNLLLGIAPERSMLDLLAGASLDEVLVEAHGIHLLPGLNGSSQLANLGPEMRTLMFQKISALTSRFDHVVVDTAAGIDATTMAFASSASMVLIVATPEPLSLADAYAAIKVLSTQHGLERAFLVPSSVRTKSEADQVSEQLRALAQRFLKFDLTPLPYIPFDSMVPLAGASGIPLVLTHPDSPASRAIARIARLLDASPKEIVR